MAFLNWSESFSVGVPSIDGQHIVLVNMVNDFYEKLSRGAGRDSLGTLFQGLKLYALKHFSYEEEHMLKYGYEGYDEHKNEHNELVARVLELETKFKSGENVVSYEVMLFLKEWLIHHMQVTDKKYTDTFLKNKMI